MAGQGRLGEHNVFTCWSMVALVVAVAKPDCHRLSARQSWDKMRTADTAVAVTYGVSKHSELDLTSWLCLMINQ